MKKGISVLVITAAFALFGCNNYFHELIPPDDDRIISFSVEGQIGEAVISDNEIDVTVDKTVSVDNILPNIKVSRKAVLIPLTLEYLSVAFPDADVFSEAVAIYNTHNLTDYVMDLIARNPSFNVPVIDKPIDFTGPVNFFVVSGQGSIRQYTVSVVVDSGEPRLLSFGFSKYDNPELIRDAYTTVNENTKTIQSAILYPMEMETSYELVPSFEILGDKIEVDGAEIKSGINAIRLDKISGTQNKTITVWRNGMSADYTLTAVISEDPDSIRSIIDFRFNKTDNPGIAATAVGSIYNSDHLGTIDVQVFYSGAMPSVLTPSFLSPGIVSVLGLTQYSAVSVHDFSQTREYRVVSRNNRYVRTYTVRVDFIDIASAAPVITSFKFSSAINHELVQDTEAQISENMGLIMLSARYGGPYAPEILVPEFQAAGIVKVFGAVQTSGFSAQNFTWQIKYTVTSAENSLLTRDYWVQVSFIRDTSSDAKINSFSFRPDENPGLADELTGRIDQIAGTITIFAPIGSGVTSRTMFPHFTAAGQVLADGEAQISGISGMLFDVPVVYEVVSANGVNRKTYTVTVRELQSTIYVNQNAFGVGDGANWTDAFRNLHDACEAAAQFPADVPKEIWIAAGTYKPSSAEKSEEYLLLTANTSYIGGFAGHETAKSQRSIAANKVIISGDLGGGKYSNNLFGSFNGAAAANVNGHLLFEDMEFTSARAAGTGDRQNGGAVNAKLAGGFEMSVRNCTFNDLRANDGAIAYVNGGKLIMPGIIENTLLEGRGAVYGVNLSGAEIGGIKLQGLTDYGLYFANCSGNIRINDVDLQNITCGIYLSDCSGNIEISDVDLRSLTDGFYFYDCSGDIKINDVDMRTISNRGIYISGSSGRREFSRITGNRISGAGLYVSGGSRVTLTDSNFDTVEEIYFYSNGSTIMVIDTKIKNVSGSNGVYASGGSIIIERVTVENVQNGRGMYIYSSSMTQVLASNIKNAKAPTNTSGGGIYISGGSAEISGTAIEDVQANSGGGICVNCRTFTMINTTIKNARAFTSGGGMYSSATTIIEGSLFENCISDNYAGALQYSGYDNAMLTITNTDFINCTARNNNKIFSGTYGRNLKAIGCKFIHNNALYDCGAPDVPRTLNMFGSGGYYEGCTFTNLTTPGTDPEYYNYYFTRYEYWRNNESGGYSGGYWLYNDSLTLKGCVFNFKSDETQGLARMILSYNDEPIDDYFLLDNVTINNYNERQPLIVARAGFGTTQGEFHIRLNNTYNGTLLNTPEAITNLVNRGVLETGGGHIVVP